MTADDARVRALECVALRHAQRRRFNERLASLRATDLDETPRVFQCECALIGCGSAIRLTGREYADVRRYARRFAVRAGHDIPEAECVVATHGSWVTVEKLIAPGADVARRMDPRRAVSSYDPRARA